MSDRPTDPESHDQAAVRIVGLVPRFDEPGRASPRTRTEIPRGYGVREQCLPFTAAAALGLVIPSPFTWGWCEPGEAPDGARRFRSPVPGPSPDSRVLYVVDDPGRSFSGNQFHLTPDVVRAVGPAPVPGLSFFDRPDQQHLVKVHLPYIWRTPAGFSTLFTPPVNRLRGDGLWVLSGLVETDWYANPVNLVLELPMGAAAHVSAGEPLAQAVVVPRTWARPTVRVEAPHRVDARRTLGAMAEWRADHSSDRSAYRRRARSGSGRLDELDAQQAAGGVSTTATGNPVRPSGATGAEGPPTIAPGR